MENIHAELKKLKAQLIRDNFEEYFNSEDFRLLSMEKDIDDLYYQALINQGVYAKDRKINAYLSILNEFMKNWIASTPNSNSANTYYKHFLFFIDAIIVGFYSSRNVPDNYDYSSFITCLNKITMLERSDIEKIEKKLSEIQTRNKKKLEIEIPESEKVINIEKQDNMNKEESIDYAIITALEDDEMEKVLPFISKTSEVDDTNNYIEIGVFKDNTKKKIVYASQHTTGMVDASILASELIIRFSPQFLIMVGVLGGKPEDTNIGDVIIATKVFEVDRGKITETGFKKETSVATITNKEVRKINREKKQIEKYLNEIDETRKTEVKLHFGPIACVNQVIDLSGFFEDKVVSIDRKAIALEMESFAVVRACELLNSGRTTPIIIKSVMDNTQNKEDNAKTYAAWTSAKTLEFILKNNII